MVSSVLNISSVLNSVLSSFFTCRLPAKELSLETLEFAIGSALEVVVALTLTWLKMKTSTSSTQENQTVFTC